MQITLPSAHIDLFYSFTKYPCHLHLSSSSDKMPAAMPLQTDSPFFALPSELRNMIYTYTFKLTIITNPNLWYVRYTAPGLLFSCQAAYHEALEYYYAGLAFKFDLRSNAFRTALIWVENGLPKIFATRVVHIIIPLDWFTLYNGVSNADEKTIDDFYTASFNNLVHCHRTKMKGVKITIERVQASYFERNKIQSPTILQSQPLRISQPLTRLEKARAVLRIIQVTFNDLIIPSQGVKSSQIQTLA